MKGWNSRSVIGAFVALLMLMFTAGPVSAQDGDDPIGGGGGATDPIGGTATGLHWRVMSGPNAWNDFQTVDPMAFAWGMEQITISAEDLALCEASENVWYVVAANKPPYQWMANAYAPSGYDAITNFAYGGRDIYNPVGGSASSSQFNDAITAWNATRTQYQQERTSLVCSGTMGEIQTVTETQYDTESESATVTGVYAYNTSVTPQVSANTPIEAQSGVAQKTAFGDLFDTYFTIEIDPVTMTFTVVPKGGTILPADLIDQANAALASDVSITHQTVDLNANNQQAMAEGGVLNVNEFAQEVSITAESTQYEERYRECTQISTDGGATWTTLSCTPWSAWTQVDDVPAVPSGTAPIQYQTGFWQMIAVHCNLPGFQDLMTSVSGETVVNDDTYGAVATSQRYDTQPAVLDFGQPGTPSGMIGFFDKECSVECVADPAGADANLNNGAVDNVRTTPPAGGTTGKYGVSADGVNNNYLEFFRDNKPNDITLDVWYPADAAKVQYDGHAPLTTTVSRWEQGTPNVDGSGAGKFTLKGEDGTSVFDDSGTTLMQTNWNPTEATPESDYLISTPTSGVLKGLHRNFTAQASWASEKDNPQVLTFKWEYSPEIQSTFPTTGLGFGVDSAKVQGSNASHWSNVEVECYANFGQNTSEDNSVQVHGSTGTGTSNTLDDGIINHTGTGLPADSPNTLFVKFVRSTTE